MAVLKRAGVSDSVAILDFHCWRHTFRTLLAAAGVPQDVAKKLGGWTQDATAARYDHDTTQARAAIDRL